MVKILTVTGWRRWTDRRFATWWFNWSFHNGFSFIRFGDATGLDSMAHDWATAHPEMDWSQYDADWDGFQRGAGPIRNRAMLLGNKHGEKFEGRKTDLLMAFPKPGSRPYVGSGSWSCMGEAWIQGIEVKIPPYDMYKDWETEEWTSTLSNP